MTAPMTAQPTLPAAITFIEGAGASPDTTALATAILKEVLAFRRSAPDACCATSPCAACMAPHLPKIVAKIEAREPIPFVLPAFPGKSPNLAKVLGVLPDMAERRALAFLQRLTERIEAIYAPGARIILASDGRVFSDAVGMRDEDVTAYRDALRAMIAELGLANVSTFNLEELYADLSFDGMRHAMMADFGDELDALRAAVRRGAESDAAQDDRETHRLYLGITRFLVEDASFPGQSKSRNQIQKDARVRAYEVIQRSGAWSGVVERLFPEAVRLSIHPHGCGAKKLGIFLSETSEGDAWITPWHGVAVEANGRFSLMKRAQAEAAGATRVMVDGRPSHFSMAN